MKSTTINTAASWAGTIQSFVDGDQFRESNLDLSANSIADRLGYLKAQADISAKTNAANTFTNANTFNTDTHDLTLTGAGDVKITAGLLDVNTNSAFRAPHVCEMQGTLKLLAEFGITSTVLPDASGTIPAGVMLCRVPAITGNRTYTLPAVGASDNRLVLLTRSGTEMFSVTLATGIGSLSAGAAGWILVGVRAAAWKAIAWSSTWTAGTNFADV